MKRKILFVDDDQNILDSFRTMLHSKRKEWKCSYVNSGAEGLKLIEQEPFDVVIADMRMPGIDGADFLKKVADIQPGTVRMILSGYSEMQALLKSVKYAHQFLSKPCSSEIIINAIRRVTGLAHILNDESVRTVVARLDALPVLPDLYIKISQELQRSEPNLKRVGELAEGDVGMAATLMKVVNSSFFGFYENISSPVRAVILLGTEAVKGLILGVHLMEKIDLSLLSGYSVEELWKHSLQTGYLAKTIARLETTDEAFVESCFTAGMLHDVGKLVFVTQMDSLYQPVLDSVRQIGGPIVDFENNELGVSHAEIGAYLLGLWGFNENVVTGVHGHHAPARYGTGLTSALVVHVANTLQHELGYPESNFIFSPMDMEYLAAQGMDERLPDWIEACKKHME